MVNSVDEEPSGKIPTYRNAARKTILRFKAGNKKFEDEPRSGRLTAISFDELKNLAEQHPYEGVQYFAASLGCSLSTKRQSDGVHWHLVRCVGGQLIAAAFISFRFRKAEPATHTYLEFMKYFLFVGLLVNIVLLISSGWKIGTALVPGNEVGNCLYQLDAVASICIGAAWLTFPKWLLHRQVVVPLDESHELCGRIMGALFVTSYAVSAHALHWTNRASKMTAVEGRVICCLCILSAQVWSQIAYLDAWSGGHWSERLAGQTNFLTALDD
ncbi:hypothetical protein NECAME_01917 [Necator americanus]|uniref:Uncharacterized protein n=1 Tax=Necator americanus TaxID=51031 RepID=W2TNP3_NECAM|nr:hypothetical protein NECAME_01917 [Necator americanus]ETN82632.1 hypothetical protein NECAME_01917 [Necator americanus]